MNKPFPHPPAGPDKLRSLPLAKAPDRIWVSIEDALDAPVKPTGSRRTGVWAWSLPVAAAAACIALVWHFDNAPKVGWRVVRLEGNPVVRSRPISDAGTMAVGEWLQTDGSSRARITVGDIGTVEVAPNSKIRLVNSSANEQRLRLASGEISASVSAPPRLFFVDTAASTAVDLGCAYTMKADADGNGVLSVTLGWVSLEWHSRESLVPAGASCRTRPKIGPGTPYFDDAPKDLEDSLANFDFANGGEPALDSILAEARVRDTLTLWHLLSRVDPADRQHVFDRITALVPLPKGVSRESALQLDPATLKHWREELAWKW